MVKKDDAPVRLHAAAVRELVETDHEKLSPLQSAALDLIRFDADPSGSTRDQHATYEALVAVLADELL